MNKNEIQIYWSCISVPLSHWPKCTFFFYWQFCCIELHCILSLINHWYIVLVATYIWMSRKDISANFYKLHHCKNLEFEIFWMARLGWLICFENCTRSIFYCEKFCCSYSFGVLNHTMIKWWWNSAKWL